MEIQKTLNSQSNLEKEEWNWRHQPAWLQMILQSYSHQDSMAQRQKYRSLKQNRKPRDKSMHLWTPVGIFWWCKIGIKLVHFQYKYPITIELTKMFGLFLLHCTEKPKQGFGQPSIIVALLFKMSALSFSVESLWSWVSWLYRQGFVWTLLFHFSILSVLMPKCLEKAMAPHSSTLAWKIPWTEEPGRLQSMGSLRVGHDWVTSLSLFTFMHWRMK